jgi:hypothetical protein
MADLVGNWRSVMMRFSCNRFPTTPRDPGLKLHLFSDATYKLDENDKIIEAGHIVMNGDLRTFRRTRGKGEVLNTRSISRYTFDSLYVVNACGDPDGISFVIYSR